MLGLTQKEAAEAAGCCERTIRSWEARESLWTAAREEAGGRWLQQATDAARRSVLKAASRNAEIGLKILERLDPAFAPPSQKSAARASLALTSADMSKLKDEQVQRIASGEDPLHILVVDMKDEPR